jgi:mannose-1-phosphate guanylyltransferase/mannose-6-phosphate isomerase
LTFGLQEGGLMNAYAIIMAGGSGERLWPLSTTERPKQFV